MNSDVPPPVDPGCEDDPILSYKAAATFLGKAYQTLANHRYSGTGPTQDGSGYRRSALVRWREEQAEKRRLRDEARRNAYKHKDQLTLFDLLRRKYDRGGSAAAE